MCGFCLLARRAGSGICAVNTFKTGKKKAVDQKSTAFDCLVLVPRRGLEPPRLSALVPETSASTNSAIWASQDVSNYTLSNCLIRPQSENLVKFCAFEMRANKKADDLWSSAFLISYLDKIGAQKRTRTSTPRSAST